MVKGRGNQYKFARKWRVKLIMFYASFGLFILVFRTNFILVSLHFPVNKYHQYHSRWDSFYCVTEKKVFSAVFFKMSRKFDFRYSFYTFCSQYKTLDPAYNEFGYSEHQAVTNNFFLTMEITFIMVSVKTGSRGGNWSWNHSCSVIKQKA